MAHQTASTSSFATSLLLFLCMASLLSIDPSLAGCGAEDSTLSIVKKCGEPYEISMAYDSMQRELLMYIPSILCNEEQFTSLLHRKSTLDTSMSHIATLPMLISLHCYGGSADSEIAKWQSFAEQFTFILIAPKGIQYSWNADDCCGDAMEQNVDDVGFIQTIINGAQTSFPSVFPSVTVANANYDGFVWIAGFSNGAFLADKIAWQSSVNQFSKIVAAAPMAGYTYDNTRYTKNARKNGDKHNSIAMYFHHSKTDTYVNPQGCCMDSLQGCCCLIGSNVLHCLSIHSEYKNWLLWNGCNADISFDDLQTRTVLLSQHSETQSQIAATCAYATPQEQGCNAPTALCMYDNIHHTAWARSIPQSYDVMLFFLKSLCLQQNGKFNHETNECECDEDGAFGGLYCISPKQATSAGTVLVASSKNEKEKAVPVMPVDSSKNEVSKQDDADSNSLDGDGGVTEDLVEPKWKQVLKDGHDRKKLHGANTYSGGALDLDIDSINDGGELPESWLRVPNASVVLICSVLSASIALFVMYRRKQAGYRYSKVNTDDEELLAAE